MRRSGAELVRTDVASAEMIKLASNAFLATKISFINEIANVSEELGADVTEVARRDGPGRADRAEVPAGGHRLWRLVPGRRGDGSGAHHGRTTLLTFEQLWGRLSEEETPQAGVIEPDGPRGPVLGPRLRARDLPARHCGTRRITRGRWSTCAPRWEGGSRCTPDHPFVIAPTAGRLLVVKRADELTED